MKLSRKLNIWWKYKSQIEECLFFLKVFNIYNIEYNSTMTKLRKTEITVDFNGFLGHLCGVSTR